MSNNKKPTAKKPAKPKPSISVVALQPADWLSIAVMVVLAIGICLFVGMEIGEHLQTNSDRIMEAKREASWQRDRDQWADSLTRANGRAILAESRLSCTNEKIADECKASYSGKTYQAKCRKDRRNYCKVIEQETEKYDDRYWRLAGNSISSWESTDNGRNEPWVLSRKWAQFIISQDGEMVRVP